MTGIPDKDSDSYDENDERDRCLMARVRVGMMIAAAADWSKRMMMRGDDDDDAVDDDQKSC